MAFQEAWHTFTNLLTKTIKVCSQKESGVYEGIAFSHHEYHTVANGANLDHLFITPSNKTIVMKLWHIKSDVGRINISVYEDTVVSANGTSETPGNNNRQSTTTPTLLLSRGPTVTSVGNQMLIDFIGATGTGAHTAVGSPTGSEVDWVLKKGTKYLLRANNASGGSADILTAFTWFEIT